MTSLYKILKSAKLGAGAAQDFHTAIMAQKMPFAKRSGAEHEYTGAVPVTFIADGTPLLDYLISGNIVQSGTPTMPEGTGERTGNLFDYKTAYESYINADGDVAATTLVAVHNSLADFVGQTVTIRVYCKTVTATRVYVSAKIGNAQKASNSIYQGNTGYMTLTVTPETADDYWLISYGSLNSGNNVYSDLMLNLGAEALPYEPFGVKIPILSANTTTPVYLGEVETTRKVKKLVLTGQEGGWRIHQIISSWFQLALSESIVSGLELCTHYRPSPNSPATIQNGEILVNFDGANNRVIVRDTTYTTVEDFKTYLQQQYSAGHPVTVWYVLATEETAVVNEPLMKIGDYADTLSHAQAGVSIPTVNGSTTLDVETAVKPSEIYIKYKS